jgi:hypothetical protein
VLTSLLWRGGARAQLAALDRDRVLQVRYEDVVESPETEGRRLAEGLGLAFEPAMLDVRRVGSSLRSDESSTGIDASHRGQWRTHLRPTEVWLSQRLSAPEYAAFDYPTERVGTPVAGVAWSMVMLPAKLALVFALNVRRSRNLLASIRRRLSR